MSIYGKGLPGKTKKLYAQWVRQYGKCEFFDQPTPHLDCSHIISRRYSRTHCDPRNTHCLSKKQHIYFTANPLEFASWVLSTSCGQYVDLMREKANATTPKFDWEEEYEFVKYLWDNQISLEDARQNYDEHRLKAISC